MNIFSADFVVHLGLFFKPLLNSEIVGLLPIDVIVCYVLFIL